MNDQTPREPPLPPPTEARQGETTGRVRYILVISVTLVVVAFAISISSTPDQSFARST
jgi:hypothetical protein